MNDLYHTGVKGMRWGHRKARPAKTSGSEYYGLRRVPSFVKNDTKGAQRANRWSFTARMINTWRTPLSKNNKGRDVAKRALYTLANAGLMGMTIKSFGNSLYKHAAKQYVHDKKNKIKYAYKKKPWVDSADSNVINMPKGSVRDVHKVVPEKYRLPNHLSHTGVKGMRWGHRKAKSTSNKKDLSHLSNDDLRKAITRKRLEQEYNSIGKPHKQHASVSNTIQTATKFIAAIAALTTAGLKVYQIGNSDNKKQKNT